MPNALSACYRSMRSSDADLAPFEQRLAMSVQWMQHRHPHFAGEVKMAAI